MRLDEPPKRVAPESIVPMINVVFLLLIFFLMSATLAPPDALDATPPASSAETTPAPSNTLVLDPSGALAFKDVLGEPAIIAAVAEAGDAPLWIRADGAASATQLLEVLQSATSAGASDVRLLTAPRAP